MSVTRILIPILILMLIFGTLSSINAGSTGKIIGKIVDKQSGEGLPGIAVVIKGTKIGTITKPDGSFIILNVPPGKYDLVIRFIGYKKLTVKDLMLKVDDTYNLGILKLEETILQSAETVVTAERSEIKLGEVQNIRSVTADEIEKTQIDNIDKLLQSQTGTVNSNGEIHIRGGRTGEISYQVDGVERKSISPRLSPAPPMGQWLPHGGTTPPNGEPYSGAFFKHHGVNPFVFTDDDRYSTFAIDVDDASYSVTRGYIDRGHLPPADAVRVEEFVNFFNYDYPAPTRDRFKAYTEGAPSYFGQNCDLVRIGIKGQEIDTQDRKPAVLTFVIDVSGSMGIDTRLGMVKKALRILVDNLREDDKVGIAVYANRGRKILDHTSIKDKAEILLAIDGLRPAGSTFAEEGLKIGYQMASENFKKGAINRIILCSDGVANVGATGPDQILAEIKKYVEQGITLTTVGFGMNNYNDVLMEKLGDKGNGHFAYVDNLQQARRVFMENLTGTLQVIAKDVKIQVDFDPEKVLSYRLLGYENRDVEDDKFRDDKEDGGEIGAGHDVTALYEIKFREGARGKYATVFIRHKDPEFNDEVSELSFPLRREDISSTFENRSVDFRLSACAAQFAEILRESYWAKGESLDDLLPVVQKLGSDKPGDDDIIEFTAMVSRTKKLWDAKELLTSGED